MPTPNDAVYRIQRPDGSYRGAGAGGQAQVMGKVWTSSAAVKNHLRVGAHWSDSVKEVVRKALAAGSEVVEYELVERRRVPVEEFLEGDS
jgi:hypothetical protein